MVSSPIAPSTPLKTHPDPHKLARERTCILRITWALWVSTVLALMSSSKAITLLAEPEMTMRMN